MIVPRPAVGFSFRSSFPWINHFASGDSVGTGRTTRVVLDQFAEVIALGDGHDRATVISLASV